MADGLAQWLDDFMFAYQNVVHAVGINGLLALSIYCVLALGQLSLGQAAFMGIGAYAAGVVTAKLHLSFWLALPVGMAAPALVALAIGGPTLRLTGIYLAIATIGLGEVFRVVMTNVDYTGGPLGLSGIPERTETWLIYLLLAVATLLFWRVGQSRVGRAMEAMRTDETAAAVMGIPLARYKLAGLVVSAMIAGLAGALSAHSTTVIGPGDFAFETAVSILSFALLGGIGSPLGPVLGAAVLTLLPEVLRPLQDFRLVFNGLIIVAAVLFMPRGVVPLRLRRSPR